MSVPQMRSLESIAAEVQAKAIHRERFLKSLDEYVDARLQYLEIMSPGMRHALLSSEWETRYQKAARKYLEARQNIGDSITVLIGDVK